MILLKIVTPLVFIQLDFTHTQHTVVMILFSKIGHRRLYCVENINILILACKILHSYEVIFATASH